MNVAKRNCIISRFCIMKLFDNCVMDVNIIINILMCVIIRFKFLLCVLLILLYVSMVCVVSVTTSAMKLIVMFNNLNCVYFVCVNFVILFMKFSINFVVFIDLFVCIIFMSVVRCVVCLVLNGFVLSSSYD